MKHKILFFFLSFLFFNYCNAQHKKHIDSLIIEFKNLKNTSNKVETANLIFNELKHKNPETAYKYSKAILSISKEGNYKKGEGIAYRNMAYYYRFESKPDSARYFFQKSFNILENNSLFEEFCKTIDEFATFECMQGNYKTAISISEKGLKKAKLIKSGKFIAMSLSRKTTIYMDMGDFESATKENISALKVLDTIKGLENKLLKAISLGHKARIEMLRGNYELTLQPLQQSLNLLKSLNEKKWMAVTYIEIGNAYWYLEDHDNAIKNYNKSLIISKEINRDDLISFCLSNLAGIYSEKGNHKEAIKTLKESIKIAKKIGSKINLITAYNLIGDSYYNSKNYELAIKNHTLAIQLSDSVNAKDIKRDGYLKRSNAYDKIKNYKAALSDIREYTRLNDSLFSLKNSKQIEELKTKYETEKKEAEITLKNEEIKTLNQEVEISNLRKGLYAGGMFTFVAVSGLLFFGFKQREKKNRIAREKQEAIYQQELAFKKKELASQTLHLVQKNTFIQELKENLEKIKQSPELFKLEFRRLVMLLKKESAEDKDWEVFKSYFSEVHNNFDNKIKDIANDITEKEIRLASFLRMNLSTKEIASMLNVLPESVLKSKYRLKLKLKLNKDTDLNTYLTQL
ncbi:tetratricopeptide repeat protein [Yeosuana marina]|uniref:tetratricopeptide repeat protein n=1 Tax=Yeosuana marina TaxID=1565536 RepID=UPI0030C89C24